MLSRSTSLACAALLLAALAGCGYPTISYGNGGQSTGTSDSSTGTGGATTTTSTSSSTGGATTTSSTPSSTGGATTTSTGTGGTGGTTTSSTSSTPTCPITHLLFSEIRTRGPSGASDEFIELYNPTDAPITLDGHWTIDAQTLGTGYQYTTHWTGQGLPIPAHGHYLIVGSAFSDGIPTDSKLSVGLSDAAGVRLRYDAITMDAVCFYQANNPLSAADFANPFLDLYPYQCEGLPVGNPHNANESADASIERKPGGLAGNCTDTNSNFDDWVAQSPSTPQSSKDPPAP